MTEETNNWQQIAAKLRKALGLTPPTPDEADTAMEQAGEVPMSEEEIAAIVEAARTAEQPHWEPEPDYSWLEGVDTESVAHDVLVLNRKTGGPDEQADQLVDKHRQAAFKPKRGRLEFATERKRMKSAGELAAEVLELTGIRKPPVDPLAIAEAEAPLLTVRGDDFRDRFDGQLEYHPAHRRFLLLYNTKYDRSHPAGEHHPRTRFSIAHELGHFYLEAHHAYLRRGGTPHGSRSEFVSDVMVEREADSFAAGLLMPASMMRPLVNEDVLTLDRIEELARRFGTSLISTTIRSVQLSDFPVAVAGVRDGAVAWSFQADCLVGAGCYPGERGPVSSPSAKKMWAEFAAGVTEKSAAQAFARHWFRTYESDNLEQLPVTEHYFPVPVMNTLVVLLTVPEGELYGEDDDE